MPRGPRSSARRVPAGRSDVGCRPPPCTTHRSEPRGSQPRSPRARVAFLSLWLLFSRQGDRDTRGVSPLPQLGLCVPQPLDRGPQMTAGTREQAVTGRPLKAGLVLASGASGAASRQSWDPGVHTAQAIRFPAPTGISPLWHSGGSSVPRHAAPKAGTRVVRPGDPSGQTSFRLPATHLTPHPGEIRAPCLLPDGRPGRTDPHGGGGAWGERLKFKGRPGVPAGLCCHAPRGPTGAGTVSPCGQAAGRGRGAVPLRASASSSVPGCDPALRETSPAPTCEGACEIGGESAS